MKRIVISAILALSMSAIPAFAGQKGGGHGGNNYGGHGGTGVGYGGHGGSGYGGHANSSSVAGITQIFKGNGGGGNGRADMFFGAAAIIGAFNPPQGQKIIVKGGDVKVQINFYGGTPQAPTYKGPMKGDTGTDERRDSFEK